MTSLLRRHGAVMTARHGRPVAAHFGSAVGEEAVCRSRAGLAVRSDRATLDVRGSRAGVEAALAALVPLGDHAWWHRITDTHAVVRCEPGDAEEVAHHLEAEEGVTVADTSADHTAIDVVGPLAADVVARAGVADDTPVTLLVREPDTIEVLVPSPHGPAVWNRLLDAGGPLGLACVGVEALERLAAAGHRPPR